MTRPSHTIRHPGRDAARSSASQIRDPLQIPHLRSVTGVPQRGRDDGN
jgi:hypothetical protein